MKRSYSVAISDPDSSSSKDSDDTHKKISRLRAKNELKVGLHLPHSTTLDKPFDDLIKANCNILSIHLTSRHLFNALVKPGTNNVIEAQERDFWQYRQKSPNSPGPSFEGERQVGVGYGCVTTPEYLINNIHDWKTFMIGEFSKLEESVEDENLMTRAVQMYKHQLDYYYQHYQLGVFAIEVVELTYNMSFIVASILNFIADLQQPESDDTNLTEQKNSLVVRMDLNSTSYSWYRNLKSHVGYEEFKQIRPALNIGIEDDIPSNNFIEEWLHETVGCIYIPTYIFLVHNGLPTLSWNHRNLVEKFLGCGAKPILVVESPRHPLIDYKNYILYIWTQMLNQPNRESINC